MSNAFIIYKSCPLDITWSLRYLPLATNQTSLLLQVRSLYCASLLGLWLWGLLVVTVH